MIRYKWLMALQRRQIRTGIVGAAILDIGMHAAVAADPSYLRLRIEPINLFGPCLDLLQGLGVVVKPVVVGIAKYKHTGFMGQQVVMALDKAFEGRTIISVAPAAILLNEP